MADTIKVLQHNVLHWRTRKFDLTNTYKHLDPDIILINSHGLKNSEPFKIHGYITHKKNSSNTHTDGTAIAIKQELKYRIIDFFADILAAEIKTSTGKIMIATLYQPPSRDYIPIPDFVSLFRRHIPVYMVTDLIANHPFLGYRTSNVKGYC